MACRVTAFSLYLSLLEGLNPSDIIDAQEQDNVQLPSLSGTNLRHGKSGDFFDYDHGFAQKRFDVIVSNPPWKIPLVIQIHQLTDGLIVQMFHASAVRLQPPMQCALLNSLQTLDVLFDLTNKSILSTI